MASSPEQIFRGRLADKGATEVRAIEPVQHRLAVQPGLV